MRSLGQCCVSHTNPTQVHRGDRLLHHVQGHDPALPDALWIPLGESAAPGVQYMVSKGLLKPGNVLSGMLHPSPATMERIQYFLGTLAKPKPSPKTNAADIDALRAGLIAKVAALPAA